MPAERQELKKETPWWGEHVHRYNHTLNHFINKTDRVLDIACGTGYGSELLAEHIDNSVIGGDVSQEAIDFCQNQTSKSNLSFKQMDGTNLPFEDNFFDVIISFETIEHTTEFDKMISEFKRAVKKEGLIILSTPNFVINSPSGIVTNPFHTQEWDYEGFVNLLDAHFSNYQLFGQKYTRYSKKSFAYQLENLLLKRGIRKLPLGWQNNIMRSVGQPGVYPTPEDYKMVNAKEEILKCKTFYAVCHNDK